MLSCCPGEDTSTEARFVWHSDSTSCTFWYAKASAPGDAVQATCESVYKPVSFRSSDVNYYKYMAELSGLEPGTEYIYYVKSGNDLSPVQKFKTAGTSGSYNFLWLSDVHSHPDNPGKMTTVELLRQDAEARTASSGGIDFVLFSGDAVKYGSRYDNWQQWNGAPAVTNYTFAMVPGNKEYYYTGSSSFYDYYWYLAAKNNPPNGPGTTEQEGCYWFLRDSVLFVGIDSLIHKGSRMTRYGDKTNVLRDQTNWFDRVVSEQKNRKSFRYLVVVQHDPWFVCSSSGFDKSRGNYDVWRHVFDKHKVDLALSGDEHNYIRTKPLRGDASNSDGTIYMVAGQIEESNYSATVTTDVSSYGNSSATKYFACMGTSNASCGAAWIEVRPTSLKVTEFWDKHQSPNYKQYDSFEITPKDRGFEYEYTPPVVVEGFDGKPRSRYRFAVDAPRSDDWSMQLSEVELLDAHGKVIKPSAFTLAYDSTTIPKNDSNPYPSEEGPVNAADGVYTGKGKWLDWRAGISESSAVRSAVWLDFCFAEPTAVYGYRWYTAWDNSTYPGRAPVSWTFSCSDDGGATRSVIDKVVGYGTTTENNALAYSSNIDFLPSSDKWLEETAEMSKATGTWSEAVVYGEDGRAFFDGDAGEITFTPYTASTGNVVTVEMKTQFNECVKDTNPDATAQAAVRLGPNGRFQVWVGNVANVEMLPVSNTNGQLGTGNTGTGNTGNIGNSSHWLDVEADGVTPVSGEEYTLRFTFDYRNGTYSVEIKTGLTEFTRLVGVESSSSLSSTTTPTPTQYSNSNFMIANAANRVSSISFVGDTFFSLLYGNCKYEVVGFQPGEISVGDATIILDAAKAAWLNKRGDYDAVKSRLANITSKEFRAAWLCNLDIMNESASAELKITSIKVNADNVEIAVSLTRTGAISQAINGSLKFYGAETLAQFKSNATKPIASTTLADEDFSEGDTVIRLFPKDDNVFFKAGIEE